MGRELDLPGDVSIRPWHYVEIVGEVSPEMKQVLRAMDANGQVQLGRVIDGRPLPKCDLGPVQ